MCVRGIALGTLATLAMLSGCEYEAVGYYPDSEMTIGKDVSEPEDSTTSSSGPQTDATDNADDAEDQAPLLTGPGCTSDDDCESETCITNAFLESLGTTGIDIPGGLCSKLLCGSDADCGPKAACIDGAPFEADGFQICLPTCDGLMDCRWEEAWGCVAPLSDTPELSVCLPDNIIVALECEQTGTCEEGSP